MTETSVYRDRARTLGPYVELFVTKLIGSGLGVIDFRRVWGLLSLDKQYSAAAIDDACRRCLDLGILRLRTVRQMLDLMPTEQAQDAAQPEWWTSPPPPHPGTAANRFARNMQEYAAVVVASTVQ